MRPLLVVEHGDDAPLGRLADLGVPADLRRPHRGEPLPTGLRGHSGLLVLGGSMAAWDDDVAPWLPTTRSLMASAVAEQVPTLGICLGAQLLALATGGAVERGSRGPEVGLLGVTATAAAHEDALLAPLAAGEVGPRAGEGTWLAPQSHSDAVTSLPEGAVLLATSAAYPVQAFRVGSSAWGVQYHPEVTPAQLDHWLADHGPDLAAAGTDAEEQRRAVAAHEHDLAALAEHHRAHLAGAAREGERRRGGAPG